MFKNNKELKMDHSFTRNIYIAASNAPTQRDLVEGCFIGKLVKI